MCPFSKSINIISFTLPPNCSIAGENGKKIQNFLSESDSSKTFWQLGCKAAALFPPLLIMVR